MSGTRQRASLPSARGLAHGKVQFSGSDTPIDYVSSMDLAINISSLD